MSKYLGFPMKFLLVIHYVPIINFCGEGVKNCIEKVVLTNFYCLGAVFTVRITENSPAIKILLEEDLVGMPEMSSKICIKD